MIPSLSYFVQDRKEKLVILLTNNADDLPLERQHQIFGAIHELDSINDLLSREHYKEIHRGKAPSIFLFKPIHSKGILQDIIGFIKDLF
jgi:hypothetical protein